MSNITLKELPVQIPLLEEIFDHIPDVAFFIKDVEGRYVALNNSQKRRVGYKTKAALKNKFVRDLFPGELGAAFEAQDKAVIKTGRPIIDKLEMHWFEQSVPGWCLTTKLPLIDRTTSQAFGLIGISRDLKLSGTVEAIPATLTKAIEFLQSNCGDELSPEKLAKMAGLSAHRFARAIKRIYRLSPGQLITKTRITAATQLLREESMTVAQVAAECGFYDHSAFTRAFRIATGVTPIQFRALEKRSSA